MIKELIDFSQTLSEDFKSLGKTPKEGLHILLQIKENGELNTTANTIHFEYYNKKMDEISPFLKKCLQLQENAWMIDTNKCLDTTTRAIHSCSPFSIAIKKDNLVGGRNYERRKEDGKNLVYDSLEGYFEKTDELFEENEDEFIKRVSESFASFFINESWQIVLKDIENQRDTQFELIQSKIKNLREKNKETKDKVDKAVIKENIESLEQEALEFQSLSDAEYIIFYVDLDIEFYRRTHKKYLDERLFNTARYNTKPDSEGLIYGTSNFMNTFNNKMPFLLHQSATFDIPNRISNLDAIALFELEDVLKNKTLPNPLPVFVYESELKEKVIALYAEGRRNFRDIIDSLYQSYKDDFQNYYLLNWSNTREGIVFNDFDFVPKFEYELKKDENIPISNLFQIRSKENKGMKYYGELENIFELEDKVFKNLIQNKYHKVNYFSEFKTDEYERMPLTFLSFSKYRKAIYDYVYKSNRNAISGREFDELIFNSILDDFKKANEYGIKDKLNYWYSLYNFFHKNNVNMASKLKEYQDFVSDLIEEKADLEQAADEHFAFAAGQIIYYLLSKSKSEDTSFRLMEPYLQKTNCKALQENIADDFARYKHENFSRSFDKVASFVLSYETDKNLKRLQPQLLSGLFANNQLFSNINKKENN
ncbi:MAG TPA: hypothetical protein VK021_09565 [Flavobacteriaceae bacterium]|nr:hypothetical protein [Flavobacteriaceae bacterium]